MSKGWTIFATVWMAVWAPLAVMFTVSAKQGVANLQSWATWVGLTGLSQAMEGPIGHRISGGIVFLSTAMAVLYYAILAYDNRQKLKTFFFPYGWPFKD